MLLAEVDGTIESADREIGRVEELMTLAGAVRTTRAATEADRERIWKARRSISPALYTIKPKKMNEDIVVPRSQIPEILRVIEGIAKRHELLIVNFGHAGDGNIHVNLMVDKSVEEERKRAEALAREIFSLTLGLGGTISGEHGVGITKAPYLGMEIGKKELGLMKGIKDLFDPRGVLNPGKIFS